MEVKKEDGEEMRGKEVGENERKGREMGMQMEDEGYVSDRKSC